MKYTIKSSKEQYKKDIVHLILHDLKNDSAFIILLGFYIILGFIFLFNKYEIFSFFPKTIDFLIFVLGAGLLGMIAFTLIDFYIKFSNVKKKSLLIHNVLEETKFYSKKIEVIRDGQKKEYLWGYYKKYLLINNTIFLVPKNKKDDFLRINKVELIDGDFNTIVSYIQSKWGNDLG